MNKLLFCLFLFMGLRIAYSQPVSPELLANYRAAKTDEEKGNILFNYINALSGKETNTTDNTLSLLAWFRKQNDEVGLDYTNLLLTRILIGKGDYPGSLNLVFSVLPRFEKREDSLGISKSYAIISAAYFDSKNYEQAADYTKKEIELLTNGDQAALSRAYNGIGCIYGEGGLPDSGMVYAQKAVALDAAMKNNQQLALSISTLGENYIAAGEYEIALPFLRRSSDFYSTKKATHGHRLDAYLKNDFAQVFLATKHFDSANHYANEALAVSIPAGVKDQNMRSYEYLYKSFEQTNQQDSVNKYYRLAMTMKDSLYNLEKIKAVQALGFREELRLQEKEAEKIKAEEDRRTNIQYALIALGIVSIIILFLLLSRSFITNTKLLDYFNVIALLIVFEFFNLLLHPFLEKITNHSPILMLLALVLIAALLVPLHHRLEKWATHTLVEKNKAIRLAEAKKTIEKLEKKEIK
jgi:hypothetical protein